MESEVRDSTRYISLESILEKFGIKGEVVSFWVPSRQQAKNIEGKHLLIKVREIKNGNRTSKA